MRFLKNFDKKLKKKLKKGLQFGKTYNIIILALRKTRITNKCTASSVGRAPDS